MKAAIDSQGKTNNLLTLREVAGIFAMFVLASTVVLSTSVIWIP